MAAAATLKNNSSSGLQGPTEIETRLFINGDFRPSKSGKTLEIINPATESVSASVYEAEEADVNAAVAAAKVAFPGWSARGGFDRASFLYKLADLYESSNSELARLEAISMGKPVGKYS
jgi:aldehyde dehydrogenase (NAD+)